MLLGIEVGTTARPVSGRSGTALVRQKRDKVVVVSYRSILAGAALVLASTATVSADGYRGMKDMPVVYSQPASWYLRGDFSYSWMNVGDVAMPSFGFTEHGNDNTWAAGGGVGYYFGRGIRGDVTYEWRGGIDIDATTPTASTHLSVKSSVLLANLYYDFRAGERLTPYVGVGLGVARHDTSGGTVVTCGGVCSYDGDKSWTAAGALMAGLSFRIDRGGHAPVSIKDDRGPVVEPGRLHVDLGYRFLYLGDAHAGSIVNVAPTTPGPRIDDITAHEIRIGLRWDIR